MEIKTSNDTVNIKLEVLSKSKSGIGWLRLELSDSIASRFAFMNRSQVEVLVRELNRLLEQM